MNCPKCGSNYTDETLEFCLMDGVRLIDGTDFETQVVTFPTHADLLKEIISICTPTGRVKLAPNVDPFEAAAYEQRAKSLSKKYTSYFGRNQSTKDRRKFQAFRFDDIQLLFHSNTFFTSVRGDQNVRGLAIVADAIFCFDDDPTCFDAKFIRAVSDDGAILLDDLTLILIPNNSATLRVHRRLIIRILQDFVSRKHLVRAT